VRQLKALLTPDPPQKEVSLVSARIGNDPTFIQPVAAEGHACY
jgi:hypothetical protein